MNAPSQPKITIRDLGLIDFKEAWEYQEGLFKEIVTTKLHNHSKPAEERIFTTDYILFCEHPHVFTLGKSGSDKNLLANKEILEKNQAAFFRINRGGDITYHGPGQIVGYPILDLDHFNLTIKKYILLLEESVIQTLEEFHINAGRFPGATGVWLETEKNPRKICAIGVRASRNITMHGFAFNINTNLNYFNLINPCGFTDKGVTSLARELGKEIDMGKVKNILKKKILTAFRKNPFSSQS